MSSLDEQDNRGSEEERPGAEQSNPMKKNEIPAIHRSVNLSEDSAVETWRERWVSRSIRLPAETNVMVSKMKSIRMENTIFPKVRLAAMTSCPLRSGEPVRNIGRRTIWASKTMKRARRSNTRAKSGEMWNGVFDRDRRKTAPLAIAL